MRKLIYACALRPLILANYWLRAKGLARDRWFWADRMAVRWGFLTAW